MLFVLVAVVATFATAADVVSTVPLIERMVVVRSAMSFSLIS
jgi:hypothetical protein